MPISAPRSRRRSCASATARRRSKLSAPPDHVGGLGLAPLTDCLDRHALEEIYRIEAPRLARYFRRRTREGDDALDLVQESFVRLAGHMAREALSHPASYLQRIARNLLFDQSKRAEAKLAEYHTPIHDNFQLAIEPDQWLAINAGDMMKLYRQALDDLPEKTREVFVLHRVDELTYKEIGARLGISIATVQYHVAKALAHLDRALERE